METAPVVGAWYETDDGRLFRVSAFDKSAGAVEIEYADGSIESLDLETWGALELSEIESPEDWGGAP